MRHPGRPPAVPGPGVHAAAGPRPRYPRPMRSGGALRIGRLAGIELRISSTWLIIAALVVYSLAWSVFPDDLPGA